MVDPFVFDVLRDDPGLGFLAGERIEIHVDRAEIRWPDGRTAFANYGRLLLLAEDGAIAWVTPARMLTFPPPRPDRPSHLRLIA